ncbi:hypothetical protein [Hyphomicrobium sp. LHD-15]|nr:hypothetical protein [Hyphomicrobium sp. LHD-15]MDQ8699463.1 hypothetical protein [Hyphomicrobium sp. LHD-15]
MHTKHIVLFGGVACILAMLAYLFVFAEAPIVDEPPPPLAAPAAQ